jgi:hypothetical protein
VSKKKNIYKVLFHNEGRVYEIDAKSIGQGDLFGFVEMSGLVFGEKSKVMPLPTPLFSSAKKDA